jgi:ABC-type lipoprotein export system ATPase subunit
LSLRRRQGISHNIIEVSHLYKTYGKGEASTSALIDVTFEIKNGEFVLIVGPSGSGKSTLLNMVGLLDKPTSGQVVIDGIQVANLSDTERAEIRKHKIGFVFQFFNLLADLTVIENVMLPYMMLGGRDNMSRRAELLLKKVGLERQKDKYANQLSGGQMQRVAVARALINGPAIVIGDEPTGNLDSKSSREVIELLKELNALLHQTFVIVTHERESFGDVDRIITMQDGLLENNEYWPRNKG